MDLGRIASRIAKIDIPEDVKITFKKELFDTSLVALKNRNFKKGLSVLNEGLQSIIDMMHRLSGHSDNDTNEAKLGKNTKKYIDDAILALANAKKAIDTVKDNLGGD